MLHTMVLSQLQINALDEGVHAFSAHIKDSDGNTCTNVHIADSDYDV